MRNKTTPDRTDGLERSTIISFHEVPCKSGCICDKREEQEKDLTLMLSSGVNSESDNPLYPTLPPPCPQELLKNKRQFMSQNITSVTIAPNH